MSRITFRLYLDQHFSLRHFLKCGSKTQQKKNNLFHNITSEADTASANAKLAAASTIIAGLDGGGVTLPPTFAPRPEENLLKITIVRSCQFDCK
jgi:hypothetical protein